MLKFVIALAFVPALVFATEGVSSCRSGIATPSYVNIVGCDATPCEIPLDSTARMVLGFKAPADIASFTPTVNAGVLGLWVPYGLPDSIAEGCDFMIDGRCPIAEGEDVEYEFQFEVGSAYPKISVDIELNLSANGATFLCSAIPIKVVA